MTTPREGVELKELLRQHGKAALLDAAEGAGLRVGKRLRCPFSGCSDQPLKERKPNVTLFAGEDGLYRVRCYRCGGGGTLVDMLMATRGWSSAEAIAHLRGLDAPAPRPQLQLVATAPADDPEKLKPAEVSRVWGSLSLEDEEGQKYLEGRGLGDAVELGLVRFATEKADKLVRRHAKNQRRVAVLLKDVVGNPRGVQFRLVRAPINSKEPKILSLTGSATSTAFFGFPELIEQADLVVVTEGLADTLAASVWARKSVVVGAAGKGSLPRLADELKRAGINIDGKLFALCPQNDRPQNLSRREFVRLSQLLAEQGAHCVMVATPEEHKDLADWLQTQPEQVWPPAEVERAQLDDGEEAASPASTRSTPAGAVVSVPQLFSSDRYGQDLSTLLALLDDPLHREAVLGRGELRLSEMSGEVCVGSAPISETDITTIRWGLEQHGRSIEGKPLKFSKNEVMEALNLLASRKRFHPLTEWVRGLKWDRHERLDVELPQAMSLEPSGLEAVLVRKWLLSAAARALQPGCKVDTVLVLAGPQGCGKSRWCRAIGGAWFTDAKVYVGDDNGVRTMRRNWIIEWAELHAVRRASDVEAVKDFVAHQTDTYRPLYREQVIEVPRHSVFCATTNEGEFLRDPTGDRRWWPVKVKEIDVAWVEANREQLIAEAAAAVLAGEKWHLEPFAEDLLKNHNAAFREHDVWHHTIEEWLEKNPQCSEVTSGQVLDAVIDKPKGQWTTADQRRVGAVLTALGWEHRRGTQRGSRGRVWRRGDVDHT